MKLFTNEIIRKLRKNNRDKTGASIADKKVVVKLFNPQGLGTWWLYSMDNNGNCFGIAQLQDREYGYTNIDELKAVRLPMGLKIERDMYYTPQTFGELL